MKNFTRNEEGVCPVCDEEGIEYRVMEPTDNGVMYPWECSKCGATGEEHYNIEFCMHLGVVDKDGEEYEYTDGLIYCPECRKSFAASDYCFQCGACEGCCSCEESDDEEGNEDR